MPDFSAPTVESLEAARDRYRRHLEAEQNGNILLSPYARGESRWDIDQERADARTIAIAAVAAPVQPSEATELADKLELAGERSNRFYLENVGKQAAAMLRRLAAENEQIKVSIGAEICIEQGWEIERLRSSHATASEENTRLRAALAMSKDPCVYCQLPKEEMAKCRSGFPGCGRADDMQGCPEFGAMLEADQLRSSHAAMVERLRTTAQRWIDLYRGHVGDSTRSGCANEVLAILAEPQAATDPAWKPKQE